MGASDQTDENRIEIKGASRVYTINPMEQYRVVEGIVYLYVIFVANGNLKRTLLLTEISEGECIPSLVARDNASDSGWTFVIRAKDSAIVEKTHYADDNEALERKSEFLKNHKECEEFGDVFELAVVKWYNAKLEEERKKIANSKLDREKITQVKEKLLTSLFSNKSTLIYDGTTDSDLYNASSVLCEYLNMKICSYRTLKASRGDDFSVYDIARASHFVVRKVSLAKKWYKKDGRAFLGFRKDTNKPCLLIPKGINRYLLYDIERSLVVPVDSEEAEDIAGEAYVFYEHLPKEAVTLKQVMLFGLKRIRTRDAVIFFVMYLLSTLIGLLLPFLNKKMYDTLIPVGEQEPINQIGLVILSCMMGNVLFGLVQNLSAFRAVKTMEYTIVSATFDRIFRLPQKVIDEYGTAEFVNRVSSVESLFSSTLSAGISAVVGFVLSLFYLRRMFIESSTLAWRGVFMTLFMGVVMYFLGRFRVSKEKARLESATAANGKLYSFLSGILKIKVTGLENRSLYEFQKDNVESIKYDIRSSKISNRGSVFTSIMGMLYTAIVFYLVVKKNQSLTIGSYSAFNSAYGTFTSAASTLVSFFVSVAALIPVMERVKLIYNEPAEINDVAVPIGRLSGEIEVNHLEFAYDVDSTLILNDINFSIKAGEYVGIVGSSGCGKSTLLKCLLGFESPVKGNIFYDNMDISAIDKVELRRQLGVVLQDGQLVVGNIYTNVTLSKPDMNADEALELLKDVGLYDDVQQMPMGIFTSIAEGGGTVSGGQKQRILLARALANNPSVLLLDEATSALDNMTQELVCDKLKERNVTRIVIAHRLSTVKNCDRILVMDKGQIVEEGNFEELMELKGLFYELAKRQQAE